MSEITRNEFNQLAERVEKLENKHEKMYDTMHDRDLDIKDIKRDVKEISENQAKSDKKIDNTYNMLNTLTKKLDDYMSAPSKSFLQSFQAHKEKVVGAIITASALAIFWFIVEIIKYLTSVVV
jgi:chromosome segregation ATPase